jgi:hypothetical protein
LVVFEIVDEFLDLPRAGEFFEYERVKHMIERRSAVFMLCGCHFRKGY